jgi:uncharacterized protein
MSRRIVLTTLGGALFILAPLLLLLAGHTGIVTSSDEGAAERPLWIGFLPALAGMALIRLIPATAAPAITEPGDRTGADPGDRTGIRRQVWWLVGIAVAFPAAASVVGGQSLLYPVLKVTLFLGGALLVTRIIRARLPAAAPARWFRPVPAILAWGVSAFAVPADLAPYRDLDRVYLAAAMTLTFLTASLLEEYFYRVTLQTRIEALYGRWPAIVATALLFAAMHLPSHLGSGEPWVALAGILAFQGFFGLFTGYLWSRYRRFWALVVVHGAVNALPLAPLLLQR